MPAVSEMVGFKLRDTDDMDVVLDVISEDNPEVSMVHQPGGYYEVDGPRQILVDLGQISARLEHPFTETDFMACISSFYGRASAEDTTFRLTSDMMTVADYEATHR